MDKIKEITLLEKIIEDEINTLLNDCQIKIPKTKNGHALLDIIVEGILNKHGKLNKGLKFNVQF